jgi:hypothetical protein
MDPGHGPGDNFLVTASPNSNHVSVVTYAPHLTQNGMLFLGKTLAKTSVLSGSSRAGIRPDAPVVLLAGSSRLINDSHTRTVTPGMSSEYLTSNSTT